MATDCSKKKTTTSCRTHCGWATAIINLTAVRAVLHICKYNQDQVLSVAQRMLRRRQQQHPQRGDSTFPSSSSPSACLTEPASLGIVHAELDDVGGELTAASLLRELEAEFGKDGCEAAVYMAGVPGGSSSCGYGGGACACPGYQSNFDPLTKSRSYCEGKPPSTDKDILVEDSSREEGDCGSRHSTDSSLLMQDGDNNTGRSSGPVAAASVSRSECGANSHRGLKTDDVKDSILVKSSEPTAFLDPSGAAAAAAAPRAFENSATERAEFTSQGQPPTSPRSSSSTGISDYLGGLTTPLAASDSSSGKAVSTHVSADERRQNQSEISRSRRQLVEDLKKNNSRLKALRLCVHCKTRPINLTLLPCGHFCLCVECGDSYEQCPICRKTILADVKTYLS